MLKILALDMSLTNAGVARLVDIRAGQPVWETETVIVPPLRVPGKRTGTEKNAPRTGVERLWWWACWMQSELRYYEREESCVIMEAPAMSGGGRVFDMGEAYGVIKLACYQFDLRDPILIPPTTLKKYATGMGDCDKQRMIDTAVEAAGEQVQDEHQADAYWLGRIALDCWGSGEPDTPYRIALCEKLRGGTK